MGKTKIECKKLDVLTGDQKCIFCHKTDIDEMKYGPIYMHKNVITHYYCLLLSSNMEQNGRDCDGILGFLANDIHKEVRRGVRLHCTYCRSGGATLGCAIAKCKVVFHLPCGMKHGTLHQFFGEFKSYCAKHRPVQRISEKILSESSKNAMCGICYEKVVPRPIHETLWAPCCQKSAFFHRECVQKLALSAGYFFKCPLCNNTNTFQKEMKEFGIYIPEQDASWECVPNAYQDLLVRHDTCDSAACSCPSGRKTNNQGTRWELILCKYCGSQGIHIGCGRLKWKSPEFVCDVCTGNQREEANRRNTEGDRHRLTGRGRTAEMHPSVSADREGLRSNDDSSSDESTKEFVTNRTRSGRKRRVISRAKIKSPSPDTKPQIKSKDDIRSAPTSPDKSDKTSAIDDVTVIVCDSDSDDDVEVVSETKGSCLKTNDGATIPIIQVRDSVKKRLNVEGDVNVLPEEIVDITIQMDGPPKKKAPSPHVEEVIYSLPPLTPKPSTSTYCAPSTSFPAPPDVTKFVLVDPSTFRPEDLPPGTVLYRSFAPMMPVPQTSTPSMQPQVQQVPQVPMPQLGGPHGRSADAKHSDLGEHRCRSRFHLHATAHHTEETSRSNEHYSSGRGRRGRCDIDRLNPRVLVSPLKCRVSNQGYFEILLPRKNLGFGYQALFGFGAHKRKTSPLPSFPAKKIKLSKNHAGNKISNGLKKKISKKHSTSNNSKKTSFRSKTAKEKEENLKNTHFKRISPDCAVEVTTNTSGSSSNNSLLTSHKSDPECEKEKIQYATTIEGKENTSPKDKPLVKKKRKRKQSPLMEWKCKKIDEYLSKLNSKPVMELDDKAKLFNNKVENTEVVRSLLDEILSVAVEQSSIKSCNIDVSSLNFPNEVNVIEKNNHNTTEQCNGVPCTIASVIDVSSTSINDENCVNLKTDSSMKNESSIEFPLKVVDTIEFGTDSGPSNTTSKPCGRTSFLDMRNKTNFGLENTCTAKETATELKNDDGSIGSSFSSCKTTSNSLESNSSYVDKLSGILHKPCEICKQSVCELNCLKVIKCNAPTLKIAKSESPMIVSPQISVENNFCGEIEAKKCLSEKKQMVKTFSLFPRIKLVNSKSENESRTEIKKQLKRSVVMQPEKIKKKKMVIIDKKCKMGVIERYFSPLSRQEDNKNNGKENHSIVPPPAKLENNRFWKMLNNHNSPKNETKNCYSTTFDSENSNLSITPKNQNSPNKIPFMETLLNGTATPSPVKTLTFAEY